jgi:hypothetical protein
LHPKRWKICICKTHYLTLPFEWRRYPHSALSSLLILCPLSCNLSIFNRNDTTLCCKSLSKPQSQSGRGELPNKSRISWGIGWWIGLIRWLAFFYFFGEFVSGEWGQGVGDTMLPHISWLQYKLKSTFK